MSILTLNPHPDQRGLLNFRFLIGLGLALFFILVVAYFFYGLQPSLAKGGEVTKFQIFKGDSFRTIGAHLSRESLVRSISIFKVYSLMSGKAQKFQPGVYELAGTMSVPEIVRVLTTGGKNEIIVTLPEGSTLKDIDTILSNSDVIVKGSLNDYDLKKLALKYSYLGSVNSLEGFIFPDTYYFKINSSPEEVLVRFLDNFNSKAWNLLQGKKNWYDLLILASLLEREVPDFNDRQIVAGILLKRVARGIPIQVDATIGYAKCNYEVRECENLIVTKKDLSLSSPYNTYQRLGLTPTPISNPGESAIKAVLTPQPSPYFYYLSASKTKETIFSKTLEEHNNNRVKYL